MHNEIVIEWKHIGKDVTNTCERCGETGFAVIQAVEEIRPFLETVGIEVRILETVLPDEGIEESNIILFNGTPLEDLIEGMTVTATPCASCACITGTGRCGVPGDRVRRRTLRGDPRRADPPGDPEAGGGDERPG